MKTIRNLVQICLLGPMLLGLPAAVQAQFTFTTSANNTISASMLETDGDGGLRSACGGAMRADA